MNRRDLAVIAFKSMALWFAVGGLTGVIVSVFAWPRTEDPFQLHGAWLGLGQAALSLPVAGLIWLVSDRLAVRVFPEPTAASAGLTRADLWSTVFLGLGIYLVSQAIPQLIYWVVVWRSAGGTTFWPQVTDWRDDTGVAYRLAFRGQLAETVARLLLGIACIAGPDRLRALAARVRREAFGTTLVDEPTDGSARR